MKFGAVFSHLLEAGVYDNSANLYSSSSNFFNVANYILTFATDFEPDEHVELHIHYYQNMLHYFIKPSLSTLRDLYLSTDVQNFFCTNLFQDSSFMFQQSTMFTQMHIITSDLALNMKNVTKPKNNIDTLREVFPQFESELETFEALSYDDDGSLYEDLSTPDLKLYYPEPFVASPSFVHEDVWFLHILQYQHWLWFFFISLIMFFFITFINTVRWCNYRTRPKRETRGVSRSKCADLITACVPVSWAISIIVSESVDASDYYDGFGTGEIVIGIRAYQWGWEYFYPKGIDLNYTVSPNYSSVVGNSLKYNNTSEQTMQSNTLWKHYQLNNNSNGSSTPAHVILSPSDNTKILNFTNFNDIGSNTLQGSKAFKKIQKFTKTNNQDLFTNISDFSSRYTRLSDLYYTNQNLVDSTTYSTLRQHNFTSNLSTQNQPNTFLDVNSVNKYTEYCLNNQLKTNNNNFDISNNYLNSTLLSNSKYTNQSINGLSDSKSYNNPLKYNLHSTDLRTIQQLDDLTFESEFNFNLNTSPFSSKFLENDVNYNFKDLKSVNQSLNLSDRTVRLTDNVGFSKLNLNNTTKESDFNSFLGNNLLNVNKSSVNKWASFLHGYRLLNNKTASPLNSAPTIGTSPLSKSLSYDRSWSEGNDSQLLKSKEESAPSVVFQTYWLTHWANTQSNHYFNHVNQLLNNTKSSSFPSITEYVEYDFKNWQSLESLEDVFWESTYSSFSQDEYLNTKSSVNSSEVFNTQDDSFNNNFRHKKFKFNKSSTSIKSDTLLNENIYSLSLNSEESFPNTSLTKLRDYRVFTLEPNSDSFDDVYENLKNINTLYNNKYNQLTNMDLNQLTPTPYTQVLDSFRADVDDISWSAVNSNNPLTEGINLIDTTNTDSSRVSNPLKLRSTAKNSMVTYSAMQKVFKSRLDEGRSNARLEDVSNSYNKYLFINAKRSNYEGLLSKNTDNFFGVNSYVQSTKPTFSSLYGVNNLLNTYFTDLPFLVSTISDSSRHLWFDWQSRWTSMEVQPSSTARYSLMGVPYTNKSFEYATQQGDEINDSENYLVRLSRARKNYSTSWSYTPYLYSRLSTWQQNNENSILSFNVDNLVSLKMLLINTKELLSVNNFNNSSMVSTPSYSNFNTPGRSITRPISGTHSYRYNTSTLVDLLTKREYLYRQYLRTKGSTLYLPNYLTSTPNNPLLVEIKNSYSMVDPSTFSSEISRDFMYQNINFFKFTTLQNLLSNLNLDNSIINNYFAFYLFGFNKPNSLGSNIELFKNQYRPMRKGITNMVRLHATGAVALPIEIRLHILASSKDVIHSWAIPSAGIKIDCVPGFSSHRVAIFLNSGIYWGQCMEICGRFHHWMPIILYFMKRDLFFLWCTHFQHYNVDENKLTAISNLNNPVIKPVTFYNWTNQNI